MEYINNANLPEKSVQYVLLAPDCPPGIVQSLENYGITPIFSITNNDISDTTKTHPDMNVVHLGKNRFICAKNAFEFYQTALPKAEIIAISTTICSPYPQDVLLNAALINERLFCNEKFMAKELLDAARTVGQTVVSVKQGYTKCNIAIVNDNAIMTEDIDIYKTAVALKMDALYIQPGKVTLNGYPYGFIGGACGKLSKDILAVTGNLDAFPEKQDISSFCRAHGVEIIQLSENMPCDIGSIIPIAY